MNIYDAILRDFPVAAYRFGTVSATSFSNLMTGNPVFNAPQKAGVNAAIYPGSMVSGPGNALMLGNGWWGTVSFNDRFNKDFTGLPFSVEMVVKMENVAGTVLLSSHTSSTDGLYSNGDIISFGVDLEDGSQPRASWSIPDFPQNYHLVGVYSGSKIMLYVDGVEVASTNLPDGHVLASKAAQTLYIGYVAATKKVLVEAPAFYNRELTATQVASHYLALRQQRAALDNVSSYSGRLFTFTDDARDILFKDAVEWDEGVADNVMVSNYLQPVYDEADLSQAGTFTYVVNSADLSSVSLYQGMKLEWNGDGTFTVQHSIDNGVNWTTSVNGAVQANTVGMSASIAPQIKVTFAAGRAKDLDVVRDMTATVYGSLLVRAVNDSERTIILAGTNPNTSSTWAEPIEMDEGTGIKTTNTNGVLQQSTQTDLTNIGTVEFWLRFDNLTNNYVFDSRSVTPSNPAYLYVPTTNLSFPATLSAVYVNGVATATNSFAPVVGQPYHIVAVWATPHNAKIDIPATGKQIQMFAHYEAQLTAAQALALYNSYFAVPVLAAEDANAIVVSETNPAAKAYVADWSITGAG